MKGKNMKGLKSFAVTFAVAAVIIAIVAVFVTTSVEDTLLGVFERKSDGLSSILNNAADDPGKTNPDGETGEGNPLAGISGDSFSMLLVCTDYRPDVYKDYLPDASQLEDKEDAKAGFLKDGFRVAGVSNICLVNCSKETGEFVFTPIPPNMNVYTGSGYETVYNIYGYYGFDYFLKKIESMTGISIDYYAVINCTDITGLVNVIGSVNCTVPCDIFTDGKVYVGTAAASSAKAKNPDSKFESFLEPCTDNIGPSSMGLLLFRDYTNGIDDEMVIADGYAKGIFRNFAKQSPDRQANYWSRIEKLMTKTNINSEFFSAHGELIAAFNDDIAKTLNYPGNFKLAGDVDASTFEPSVSKAVEAFSKYR